MDSREQVESRELIAKSKKHTFCGSFSLRGSNASESVWVKGKCKCWSCAHCAVRKQKRYRRAICKAAEAKKLTRFLTLTLDPKKLPEGTNPVKYLRDAFNKFRVYLHRKHGEAPEYICVMEFHKNGMPHLHLVVDRYITQQWIQQVWKNVGGGMHVHIKQKDPGRSGAYLAKYLSKDLMDERAGSARRVTCSRGIKLNEVEKSAHTWEMLRVTLGEMYRRFQKSHKGLCDVLLGEGDAVEQFTLRGAPDAQYRPAKRYVWVGGNFEYAEVE